MELRESYKPVIVESPLSGDFNRNIRYARLAMHDCLVNYGEAPYASHLLYPQCLDDRVQVERDIGMQAGFAVTQLFTHRIFYQDLGTSTGMKYGLEAALKHKQTIIKRYLPEHLLDLLDAPERFKTFQTPGW